MDSGKPDFSILDHTADLGILVNGRDLRNLFEGAAESMTQIMVKGDRRQHPRTLRLSVAGEDLADLMVRWLGEILYLFEGEREILSDLDIDSISPTRLDVTLKTVPFNPDIHEILCEIKAVTYHQIQVAQKGDQWQARIFFDL